MREFAYVVGFFYLIVGTRAGADTAGLAWAVPRIEILLVLTLLNLATLALEERRARLTSMGRGLLLAWASMLTLGIAATAGAPSWRWSLIGGMGDGLLYWLIVAGFFLSNAVALRIGGRPLLEAQVTGVLVGVLALAGVVIAQMVGLEDGAAWIALNQGQMPNGFYGHRGHAAFVLAFGAVVALLEHIKGRLSPWAFWLLYSTICAGLWLASTRGALLGFAAGLVVLAVRRNRRLYPDWLRSRQVRKVLAAALVAALIFTAVNMSVGFGYRGATVEQLTAASSSLGRLGHWTRALELWPERPLLGHGFGGYRWADDRSQGSGELLTVKAHNLLLDLLVSRGLLGLLAFAVLWTLALRSMRGGWSAAAVVYLVYCLTWFESAEYSHLAWWAVSIGASRLTAFAAPNGAQGFGCLIDVRRVTGVDIPGKV